jgi:putative ABC transport system permease protein
MDGGNVSLASATTLVTIAEQMGARMLPSSDGTGAFGTGVSVESVATLALVLLLVGGASLALALFFRTGLGLAMRATGDNSKMARAVAINVEGMLVLGLALSNGLIALSGALFAQYQGFANIEMGIGMIVTGLGEHDSR